MTESETLETETMGAVTYREVRSGYDALLQLSSYREEGADGPVRNFLRGQPQAKRTVTKLLAELRPLFEGSEEACADWREQYSTKQDAPELRKAITAHLKETVPMNGATPLRASQLDEKAYGEIPAHLEHLLGPFYVDDQE